MCSEPRAAGVSGRKDVIWQQPTVASNYMSSTRQAIPLANEQLDAMVRVVRGTGCPTSKVIDLGAGDGELAAIVAGQFPVERITLVDFSAPMLQRAIARFTGWQGEVDVVEADLTDEGWRSQLPESVAPYDLVVSRYAIHHLTDTVKQRLYAEVFGLLCPGGLFVNIEHVASGAPVYSRIFYDLLDEGIRAAGADGSASPGYTVEEVEANILAPADAQCDWLRGIGFVDVDVVMKVFELAVIVARRPGTSET